MSVNRVDVQHAVKEEARFMAEPTEGVWIMLKRLVRYFVGHGRLGQVIPEQRYVKAPRVDTDSDCARCVLSRKSTTCALLVHGVKLIKSRSWTQGTRSFECCRVRVLRRSQRWINFVGCQKRGDRLWRKRCAVCACYGQQFSQEYHGETWGRTDSTSALSHALVARTC